MKTRKKLIEVALPLDAINAASVREKSIRHGHPSTLHLWWARRPLAAARAVIFAQMVDDPSAHPELFPTEEAQETERQRLFTIIEEMVKWENTTNDDVLDRARNEIWVSWKRTCADNADHPRAAELFNPDKLPAFHDPFAGGGSLPLEAQRLGLEAYASDLNPVAVLINKAMIEIPPKFAGRPPVNPEARQNKDLFNREWKGAQGLAEDVRYYGKWMRDEAEKRIGHLYPKVEVTEEMAKDRPDLKPYIGKKLTVIAWIWARTVKSPNPAFAHVDVPLASTFMLSTKPGKEAYIEPVIEGESYKFTVKMGKPIDLESTKKGTKMVRANFQCLMSGSPIAGDYIKAEGKAGLIGARLMTIVAEGERERVYLFPTSEHEAIAKKSKPEWRPEGSFVEDARAFTPCLYGLNEWKKLFTDRQTLALTTLCDLVGAAMERIHKDAVSAGFSNDSTTLRDSGTGAQSYCEAVSIYLMFAVSRISQYWSNLTSWHSGGEKLQPVFGRQAIPMIWDFAEGNPLSDSTGNFTGSVDWIKQCFETLVSLNNGSAIQQDAGRQTVSIQKVLSTDPPYYDNVPYADLSDFFYVWLRHALRLIYPKLLATLEVPKADELVATPYRHGGRKNAEVFFLSGMSQAMHQLAKQAHPAFPVTIYYAFKQSENQGSGGVSSTGWETFLDAVIQSGFGIRGTWPMRTEMKGRVRDRGISNALASSIILVCRKRPPDAPITSRREFVTAMKTELPIALRHLQQSNIAPVDLAQSAIGPGMAIFTRYSKVLDTEGNPISVREALALINQTLDEVLAEQEGDFDPDTRWALAWFDQHGFDDGEYGVAETLSKAKNTSVSGMVHAGILVSKAGKVRILRPSELPKDWDPDTDTRFTIWEMVHHLIRVFETGGDTPTAELVARLGSKADAAREIAYRLYTICERKKRASEALSYNALVQNWPVIIGMSYKMRISKPAQGKLF